jgi:hypothetical protein
MQAFHFIDHPKFGRIGRDREPNLCPHCAHRISGEEREWSIPDAGTSNNLECVFKCPNSDCGHLFIAIYMVAETPVAERNEVAQALGLGRGRFELRSSWPTHVPETTFSAEIAQVSPSFVDIFNQAEEAEARKLLQVCGLGYRKAVEFLVKDFCAAEHPTEADLVKRLPLAQCISKYIDDARIEASASRATWLGNDEAHYVRKWAGQDIADLKVLIRLTCNWIESALLTRHYEQQMPRS